MIIKMPVRRDGTVEEHFINHLKESAWHRFACIRFWIEDETPQRVVIRSEARLCTRTGNTRPVYAPEERLTILPEVWSEPRHYARVVEEVEQYLSCVLAAVGSACSKVPEAELIERTK